MRFKVRGICLRWHGWDDGKREWSGRPACFCRGKVSASFGVHFCNVDTRHWLSKILLYRGFIEVLQISGSGYVLTNIRRCLSLPFLVSKSLASCP